MRYLIPLLISISAVAQPITPFQQRPIALAGSTVASIPGPNTIHGLALWWVASDLASGTVTNWPDRIRAAGLSNSISGNRPSKSGSFVSFSSNYLSNNMPVNPAVPWSFAMILTSPGPWTGIRAGFLDGGGTPDFPNGFWFRGNNQFWYITSFNWTPYTLTNGSIHDLIVDVISSSVINLYTNGIFVSSVNPAGLLNQGTLLQIGNSTDQSSRPFTGNMYEIMVLTNSNFGATGATTIHKYSTNLYLYTP